jgi:hypothetical protein
MKLQTYCKSFQKAFFIKSKAGTRSELEDEIGAYFNNQCIYCLKNNEYHVNNILLLRMIRSSYSDIFLAV